MERRVKGAREAARPGANEEGIKVIKRKRKSSRDAGFYKTLDEFF